MNTETTRRAFCAGSLALAVSPSLSFIATPAPSPDALILKAVAEWLRLEPVLTDLEHRRVAAFDASRALVGPCPMGDVAANHAWHDAWNLTECGRLEWEWERVARISDGHLTYATNTRAVTADGIAGKILRDQPTDPEAAELWRRCWATTPASYLGRGVEHSERKLAELLTEIIQTPAQTEAGFRARLQVWRTILAADDADRMLDSIAADFRKRRRA